MKLPEEPESKKTEKIYAEFAKKTEKGLEVSPRNTIKTIELRPQHTSLFQYIDH